MYRIHGQVIFSPTREKCKKLKEVEYDGFRKSMANFACLVNEPLAFLLFYTPFKVANPIPLSHQFITKYIEYHRKGSDTPLIFNELPCYNNGSPIMCVGSWNSFENIKKLGRMHNNYSNCYLHLGALPYSEKCVSCLHNTTNGIM